MSSIFKRGNAQIQGNLTPMIDMSFLLIVFFVLVSRIVDREAVEMNLPEPRDALTEPLSDDQRVVVNVLPGERGSVRGYRVGGATFAPDRSGIVAMTGRLEAIYRVNPAVHVNVRADRTTAYEHVEPVLQAVSQAMRGSPSAPASGARVNLVVVRER